MESVLVAHWLPLAAAEPLAVEISGLRPSIHTQVPSPQAPDRSRGLQLHRFLVFLGFLGAACYTSVQIPGGSGCGPLLATHAVNNGRPCHRVLNWNSF